LKKLKIKEMGSVADYSSSVSLIRKDGTSKYIASVSNEIYYYDNDDEDDEESGNNEMLDDFVITQEFINSLKPGDIIRLYGDGSCY